MNTTQIPIVHALTMGSILCLPLQVEKGLNMQLTALTEQHTKTQEALKEKEKGVQQLQAQLTTAQGSFSQEKKKLESQVTELQGSHAKKVR